MKYENTPEYFSYVESVENLLEQFRRATGFATPQGYVNSLKRAAVDAPAQPHLTLEQTEPIDLTSALLDELLRGARSAVTLRDYTGAATLVRAWCEVKSELRMASFGQPPPGLDASQGIWSRRVEDDKP